MLSFRADAFSTKNLAVVADLGYGPQPGDDTRDISIETEPAGAEVYLDNQRYWKPTNVILSVPFAKSGNAYVPHHLLLRLAKDKKTSGVVTINYNTSFIKYKFETGALDVK